MSVKRPEARSGSSEGPSVDQAGVSVIDPTTNVTALVEAAVRRLDDLREAETGKREAISLHLHEIIELRALHAQQLREAEAKRIDAIRAVDVMAASVDRERAAAAATVLANQVANSAETLRALVASTASQTNDRLAALEKAANEGAGRGQATEPQMAELLREMKQVRGTSGGGQSAMFGWIIGAIGAAGVVASIIFAFTRGGA